MILRVCVVIPTYNNSLTISDVVKDVVLQTPFPVLVIDDGSEQPVSDCLYSWDVKKAMEAGRVRVVRFAKNQGKGVALRTAIRTLVSQGFTHMLTMDGDGQHLASEIQKLVTVAKEHPWDLIIGHRHFKGENVPGASKFGRKFSNFWVAYQTGMAVRDSQSGFRIYPLFFVQNYAFFTKKFDFEIEVLIRLIWNRVQVREAEIDVVYQKPGERVSHFHKFWDNVRLSVLNTALVVITLLKSRRSPAQLALSVGLGVLIGCTPFFGFHTLMVAGASFLLRLNGLAMLLGSQVSIPPLAPLVILASIYLGGQWLHVRLISGPIPHFYQWVAGSLLLGLGLGILAALVTYLAAHLSQRRRSSNWNGRARGGRFGNGFLMVVLRHLGLRAGYFCLYFIVPYFYVFTPQGRRGLQEYYKIARPRMGFWRRQGQILRHYFRYGQVLMDRVFQGYSSKLIFEVKTSGRENILRHLTGDSNQGVLLLGGHIGGWDLSSSLLSIQGLSGNMFRVEHKPEGYSYHGMTEKLRKGTVSTVDSKGQQDAIFLVHQALKAGKCVALMGDRPIADRFELIPFLGKLAPFDVTAFRLAAATQAPLLFTFGFKGDGNCYEFYASSGRKYAYNPELPRELQLYAWVESFVREVEKYIDLYPEQWFNFYPFWSALPTAPDGSPVRSAGHHLLEELPISKNWESAWASESKSDISPVV